MDNVDAAADKGIVLPRIYLDFSIGRHQQVADASAAAKPVLHEVRS